MKYPNLITEMTRTKVSENDIAKEIGQSGETVEKWLKGNVELPIGKAFEVQEKFFPTLPLSYLFGLKVMTPQ